MNRYKFVWKGKDPQGKTRSERVTAENAQAARQQLADDGWTDLELVMDEICSSSANAVESDEDLGPLYDSADEEVEYFQGKRAPFFGPWLKSLWDSKGMLGVAALFIGWGIYRDRTWPLVFGGLMAGCVILLFPVLHFFISGNSRDYSRLNRAKVWARHREVLACVERLRRKRNWLGTGIGEMELVRCQAQALAGLGKLETAVATYKQFENDPKLEHWLYLSHLSGIYDAAKAFDRSLELRKQVAQEKPDSSAVWIDLAYGHVRGLNQPAEARAALAEAEKREITGLGKAYLPFLRGIICWREKNFTEARSQLEQALAAFEPYLHSDLAEGLVLLSKSYLCAAQRGLGNSAEADKLLPQVEKFLTAQRENELLAACRGVLTASPHPSAINA